MAKPSNDDLADDPAHFTLGEVVDNFRCARDKEGEHDKPRLSLPSGSALAAKSALPPKLVVRP